MWSCDHVIMPSCHHAIMPSCNHGIMSSCHHGIMLSCHRVVMSWCHQVIMWSCDHVIISSSDHVIMSSSHYVMRPHRETVKEATHSIYAVGEGATTGLRCGKNIWIGNAVKCFGKNWNREPRFGTVPFTDLHLTRPTHRVAQSVQEFRYLMRSRLRKQTANGRR